MSCHGSARRELPGKERRQWERMDPKLEKAKESIEKKRHNLKGPSSARVCYESRCLQEWKSSHSVLKLPNKQRTVPTDLNGSSSQHCKRNDGQTLESNGVGLALRYPSWVSKPSAKPTVTGKESCSLTSFTLTWLTAAFHWIAKWTEMFMKRSQNQAARHCGYWMGAKCFQLSALHIKLKLFRSNTGWV